MFSLLNNNTSVGNCASLVCNFLSFSAATGWAGFRDFCRTPYVVDSMAVTKLKKPVIGL